MPGNRVTQPVKGPKGDQGYSIKSASLVGDNLVLQSTNGLAYDVGSVRGANGTNGTDISVPTEPNIVVDNFLSQGDGNTSGGYVTLYSTDGEGLLHTNSKTLSSNGLVQAYEGDSETDHLGLIQLRCLNDSILGDVGLYTLGREQANIIDFTNLNTMYVVVKTPNNVASPNSITTSTNYDIYIGLFSDGTAPPTDGIYFRRLNGAAWTPVCKTGANTTTGTTTAYANNTWYTLRIRKVSSTEVGFKIDNGTEVIISTNIPTGYLNCGIMVKNNTANSAVRYLKLDFFSLKTGTGGSTGSSVNIVGTANEVEVSTVSQTTTIGLPDNITLVNPTITGTTTINGPVTLNNDITASDGSHLIGNVVGNITVPCKNTSGVTLPRGTPVYATGTVGSTSTIEIARAKCDDFATMAAIGVLEDPLNNNEFGHVITHGTLRNVDTSGWTVGQDVYVSDTNSLIANTKAYSLTNTEPPKNSATVYGPTMQPVIQRIGHVARVNSNTGEIHIHAGIAAEKTYSMVLSDLGDCYIGQNGVVVDTFILMKQPGAGNSVWSDVALASSGLALSGHTHNMNGIIPAPSALWDGKTPVWSDELGIWEKEKLLIDPADPTAPIFFVEDFLNSGVETGEGGLFNWNLANGQITVVNSEVNHPGIIRYRCAGTANTVTWLSTANTNNNTVNQIHIDDLIEFTIIFRENQTELDTYRTYGMLGDATNTAGQPNGIYIQKDIIGAGGAGSWNFVSQRNTASRTSVPWITQNTSWHKVVVKISAASISFYADGATTPTATITTNIPTSTVLAPYIILTPTGSSLIRTTDFDFFSYRSRKITR
jgi:hypothetical protein